MREYSFDRPLDRFHRTAKSWFDGSVESVDRRLADCRQLLASSMAAVGSNWGSEESYAHIERIASLQAQERVLEGQRESLLTAGNDRHHDEDLQTLMDEGYEGAEYPGHDPRNAAGTAHDKPERHLKVVSSVDRRYVELEAAKFVASNPGVDRDELITRARHQAQLETSTFSRERSRAVTAAFSQRVAQLHRPAPRQRIAAAPSPDGADEMLFV